MNNTFCPNLWKGLYIGTLGEVKPCCFWPDIGNINLQDISNIWNSNTMKQARRDVLKGKKIEACRLCYEQEERGQGSTRLGNIKISEKLHNSFNFVEKVDVDPWFVDLRMSNKCNLQCKTCYAGASSVWERKVGLESGCINSREVRENLQNLIENSSNIQEIYFAGGEPTIIEEDTKILEHLIKQKKTGIRLRYNTNGTTLALNNFKIIELWQEWVQIGGKLHIALSVDGIGDVVEYVRTGTNWDILDKNLHILVENLYPLKSRVLLEFSPVVSILTVLGIPDLIDYVVNDLGMNAESVRFHNILDEPQAYDLRLLPIVYKSRVKTLLKRRLDREQSSEIRKRLQDYYETVKNVLGQERKLLLSTEFTATYYPEPFNSLFPELANWWENVRE